MAASDPASKPSPDPTAIAADDCLTVSSTTIALDALPDAITEGLEGGTGSNTADMDTLDEDLQTAIAMSLSAEDAYI